MIQGPLWDIIVAETKDDPMCIKPEDLVEVSQK